MVKYIILAVLLCSIGSHAAANDSDRLLLLELPYFPAENEPQIRSLARQIFSDSYKEIFNLRDLSEKNMLSRLSAPNLDQIFCTEKHNRSAYHVECKFARLKPSQRELSSDALGCLSPHRDDTAIATGVIQALRELAADMNEIIHLSDAEYVYKKTCFACHDTGAAGAPRLGDKAAWAPRIKKGMAALKQSTLNGFSAMPPRGTCGQCSDEELEDVVRYMIEKSK